MNYTTLLTELEGKGVGLVAVSKTKPVEDIRRLYDKGHRDFGENRVQEMLEKMDSLPDDVRWHLIGHLQKNKVKYIVGRIHLLHSLDNLKLARTIEKEAKKANVTVSALIQIKIAREDSKYGYDWDKLQEDMGLLKQMDHLKITGVMGMGTLTDDESLTHREFEQLKNYFLQLRDNYFPGEKQFREISMGMSGDYRIALEHGTTMVRIGSLLFGERN